MSINRSYSKSEEMLARSLKSIPLGSQTFSKSKTQFPHGVSPFFIQRGKGSRVWDIDGNEYIDFICALGAMSLGYGDPDVQAAVKAQLEDGTIFSLAHPLEVAVAEKMKEMIPCCEMVRYGKNGSDATAGAVRLARAYTGRDYVAVCGYHGWQDWYIGSTTRNLGVPGGTCEMTLRFEFNNADSLARLFKQHEGKIGCVIMEAMSLEWPKPGFLQEVKALCEENGAVFVIDEMVTGFRFANGGAEEYFGVTPDLATFGKGMANGYAISVVCGRADILSLMEECFFSFTFGGETLSLAAALATMTKYQTAPVVEKMMRHGNRILSEVNALIAEHGLADCLQAVGHPSFTKLMIHDTEKYDSWAIRTLYMQEMLKRGILTFGSHTVSYAHSDEDVSALIRAYAEVLPILVSAIKEEKMDELLECEKLIPLFQVR